VVFNIFDIYVGLLAVICASVGVLITTRLSRPKVGELEDVKDLTLREHEVLELLTQGCSNAEIAEKLFLSLSTVKTHVSSLFVKMSVKNRTQAVEKANRLRLTGQGRLVL